MTRWPPGFASEALGLPGPAGQGGFTQISTDTRTLLPGALFVALRGERFDGHDHLAAARDRGATAALVRRGTPAIPGLELIEVDDTLRAYGDLARARRREVHGPVVAVTGTNGKTSTKEMLAAVLGTRFRVSATRANLNNLVGVPLTILESPADVEALVVEAGANLPGEIGRYREVIEPTIAVVTNVGAGHLEGFGSLDGVMEEKLALVSGVPLAVVGTDPPALGERARASAGRVVTAGLARADVTPTAVAIDARGHAVLRIEGEEFRLPYPGRHLAANAMLAWTVARELELSPAEVARALTGFTLPGGRGELVQHGGITILNDCYNANPQSFASAIATAAAMRGGRRLVFVAGTMRELGTESAPLHARVAAELVALAPDVLAAVGEFVPALAPFAARLGERLITAPDPMALGPALQSRLQGEELVVLKASRGVALERILPFLAVPPTHASEA